ncbi:hypothetical protein DSLASN_25480 [Desulfoluna limicola]|uniref:DUF2971 domain-containing protein n=1 Tax=Desulfoluna limicola TaxID=2810562 RepID=A0ABM7PIL0_9BACT|nr:DUF2971 domain-containing protein [Desulfoluna limicola]BCS96916.1 hypothetical protein DSLASN_25480 [Desulfoluna limicola]
MAVPEILYKYTTAETAKIILNTGKLRWQSPCQFNDVQELQRMPLFSPTFEEARPLYAERLYELAKSGLNMSIGFYSDWTKLLISELRSLPQDKISLDKTQALVDKYISENGSKLQELLRKNTEQNNDGSLRCFCLTENSNHTLMWAHYADSHKGCLFGLTHIKELSTPFLEAEKVQYSDTPPIIGSGLDFYLYGPSKELNRKTRLAIYHCKSEDWSYEKEWRVIHKNRSDKVKKYTDYKFYKNELESITFGLKTSDKDKKAILKIIESSYPHCKIYQMTTENGSTNRNILKG